MRYLYILFFSFSLIADDHLIADDKCKEITKDKLVERTFSNSFNGIFNGKKIEYQIRKASSKRAIPLSLDEESNRRNEYKNITN